MRSTRSRVSNRSVNGTASRKPVSTWTPVCVDLSSWISSVQLRLIVCSGMPPAGGSGSGVLTPARYRLDAHPGRTKARHPLRVTGLRRWSGYYSPAFVNPAAVADSSESNQTSAVVCSNH